MAPRPKSTKPKKTAKQAADDAEQRAAKAPKAKTEPKAVAAPKPVAAPRNDDLDRALFLTYLPKLAFAEQAIRQAKEAIAVIYKEANQHGFSKKDFDEVKKLQGAEGEKVKKAAIVRSLRIARWLGMDLGAQLDMFEQDERVPAADRCYEEGKTMAMSGQSLKTDHAPETEQYRETVRGWHDGQAIISRGFKKLHPAVAEDEADKAAKAAARKAEQDKDAAAFDAPASGVAMTRAEFEAQKLQQQTS